MKYTTPSQKDQPRIISDTFNHIAVGDVNHRHMCWLTQWLKPAAFCKICLPEAHHIIDCWAELLVSARGKPAFLNHFDEFVPSVVGVTKIVALEKTRLVEKLERDILATVRQNLVQTPNSGDGGSHA